VRGDHTKADGLRSVLISQYLVGASLIKKKIQQPSNLSNYIPRINSQVLVTLAAPIAMVTNHTTEICHEIAKKDEIILRV
jgi:hypothetical protein